MPLFAGLFWKRATTQGALTAMVFGMASWLWLEYTYVEADFWPPQLAGLLFSVLGMVLGSLLPQMMRARGQSCDKLTAEAAVAAV
ncbi:hypothetical protein D9M72_635550 [compost metagenome]